MDPCGPPMPANGVQAGPLQEEAISDSCLGITRGLLPRRLGSPIANGNEVATDCCGLDALSPAGGSRRSRITDASASTSHTSGNPKRPTAPSVFRCGNDGALMLSVTSRKGASAVFTALDREIPPGPPDVSPIIEVISANDVTPAPMPS